MDQESEKVKFRIFPLQYPGRQSFPEISMRLINDKKSIGIAFSGGGSRSLTLSVGYLRQLKKLKILDKVSHISSVSGGAWASCMFIFPDENEYSDTDLLGLNILPAQCSLQFLKKNDPGKIAMSVHNFLSRSEAIKEALATDVPSAKKWQKIIGKLLLKGVGLDQKIMMMSSAQLELICRTNGGEKWLDELKQHVVYPRKDSPFFIINANLGGPPGYTNGWGIPLQYTPLYTGVPFYRDKKKMFFAPLSGSSNIWGFRSKSEDLNAVYKKEMVLGQAEKGMELTIGGGVIDTFAFGACLSRFFNYMFIHILCLELAKEEDYFPKHYPLYVVEAKKTEEFLYLEDAIGASSAGFTKAIKLKDGLNLNSWFSPSITYWPVLSKKYKQFLKKQQPRKLSVGDGALIDNTGVLPLLQRGLRNIICFINSYENLDVNFVDDYFISDEPNFRNPNAKKTAQNFSGQYHCASSDFLSLFGAVTEIKIDFNYYHNQVFQKAQLNVILKDMVDNFKKGKGAVCFRKLHVLDNQTWNIVGGFDVNILFVHNEVCGNFMKKLPVETREEINKGKDGLFPRFPFYSTVGQNDSYILGLSKGELNLLSAQAECLVAENVDLFTKFMSS